MKETIVNLKDRSYPIYIGAGLLSQITLFTQKHIVDGTIAIITDHNVYRIYGKQFEQSLQSAKYNVKIYSVPAGEASKSLAVVESLIGKLIQDGLTRQATIFALGGGVVGDLVGFVAATFLRGVDYVQIPTTLLAQVDSSVGGKVGVNHALGKNLIGAFLQPKFVLIDPNVLKTLDQREIKAGLAEVIKYGLIKDIKFFNELEEKLESLISLSDEDFLIFCLEKCCRIKADIVERDEKESGERRLLNFGHTIGHALEAITDYNYFRHGEAVLWGMRAVAKLSSQLGFLSRYDSERIYNCTTGLKAPALPKDITSQQIIDALARDKKQTDTGLKWVLLKEIGKGFVTGKVDQKLVYGTIRWLINQ